MRSRRYTIKNYYRRIKVFEYNYNQIKSLYSSVITSVWEESRTIIMANTSRIIGEYPISDIFCVFDSTGEMVIYTERIYRKNYNIMKWLRLLFKARQRRKSFISDTVHISVTKDKTFTDITYYKKWWHEWARELI
jgi:hypothetical protein